MSFIKFWYKLTTYLVFRLRIYTTWSRLHRFFFDRAAQGQELPIFENPKAMAPYLRGMGWRPDSWVDMFDAICTPEMVWHRYLNSVDHSVGDCDEFAVFIANVIARSLRSPLWDANIDSPSILSVAFIDDAGRAGGHNVCLMRSWHRIGAKFYEQWGYQDYGDPVFFGSKEKVVEAIKNRYAGVNGTRLCWAVLSPTLELQELHWG